MSEVYGKVKNSSAVGFAPYDERSDFEQRLAESRAAHLSWKAAAHDLEKRNAALVAALEAFLYATEEGKGWLNAIDQARAALKRAKGE